MSPMQVTTSSIREQVETIYLLLTEAELLIDEMAASSNRAFDRQACYRLSNLAKQLDLHEVCSSLAELNATEFQLEISAAKRTQVRAAFDAGKLTLFRKMDSESYGPSELGCAA